MSPTRIVNLDVKNGLMFLTRVNSDGTTQTVKRRFKHFILSPEAKDERWLKLKGSGYFRYIKLYDDRETEFWNDYRLLTDKFAIHNDIEAARVLCGVKLFEGLSHHDLCTLAFDIETNGLSLDSNSKIFLISCAVLKGGETSVKLFSYDEYPSQKEMLQAFVRWVSSVRPDLFCAYNGYGFDWGYIIHVAKMHNIPLTLGRDGSEIRVSNFESSFRKEGGQEYPYRDIKIQGVEYVDVMFLVMRSDQAARQFESYALKSVIKKLGLEREDRQHYDASQIQKFHKDPEEWRKIKAYALDDARDCLVLLQKYIPPYFAIAKLIPKSLSQVVHGATGSQINSCLVASYLRLGHSIPKASSTVAFEGGMTVAKPGLWKNAFRVDVASLYPSICLNWNIHDPIKDPNNHFIKFLAQWTQERLSFKAKYEETGDENAKAMSAALKILANSFFGMMGAPGLNFNSPEKAAEVTRHGREILKKAIEFTESQGFEVFFGDTDSLAFVDREVA